MENQQQQETENNNVNEEEKKLVPDVDPVRVMLYGLNNYTTDK